MAAKGILHEDYSYKENGFDNILLETLRFSLEETINYLMGNILTYPECEKWVLLKNNGSLNPEVIENLNATILNATYSESERKEVFAVSDLEDDGTITDAVTLGNFADWEEFHRSLVSGYEENTADTVTMGGCHCGAIRYRVINQPTHGESGFVHR